MHLREVLPALKVHFSICILMAGGQQPLPCDEALLCISFSRAVHFLIIPSVIAFFFFKYVNKFVKNKKD